MPDAFTWLYESVKAILLVIHNEPITPTLSSEQSGKKKGTLSSPLTPHRLSTVLHRPHLDSQSENRRPSSPPASMAPDEYSTGGGGKLKLKGSKVSDGRVDKKKKKKAKKDKDATQGEQVEQTQQQDSGEADSERATSRDRDEETGPSAAKTEAERKYEEVRRKRVC